MSRISTLFAALALAVSLANAAPAEPLSALARLDHGASSVRDAGDGVAVTLAISQPVPWRVQTLADPPRLVVDFREIDWRGADPAAILVPGRVTGLRAGAFAPGWSRLVLDLAAPFSVRSAGMETGGASGGATIRIRLVPGEAALLPAATPTAAPIAAAAEPAPLVGKSDRLTVVLDPGHGGLDPGAEGAEITEAAFALSFARQLREALVRAGFQVVLTREDDVFVPLDARITIARAAGADVFLSLHADALAEGRASGASVYTLSETASDEAAAALAERHERSDLVAGVDLSGHDDIIAGLLIDIARRDTRPRSEALADAIVAGLGDSVGGLHKRPRRSAGFSVLRAPDIPSALIELGYLSTPGDRDRLISPEWRTEAVRAVVEAIEAWVAADAARAALLRR